MNGYSQTPQEERIKILQSLMPEVFDEGKIDWEKLKATLGEDVNFANERYVLNWAGKSDAFRMMQQPSSATLVPCREESVDFDQTENIFIEGENMEVLKVLQKSYFGKVKMIYIDPPYNTGNDSFIYPDKFSETKEEYLRRVGDKDEEGYMTREGMFRKNSKENGQYHSNWLNMMMPRLYLAKSLLREDGVLFVSIDDNEVHNLRLLMNEIFGEENFVAQMVWEGAYKNAARQIGINHEYVLVYTKNDFEEVSWMIAKQDVDIVLKEAKRLQEKHGEDYKSASTELAGWFLANKAKPVFAHRRFHLIDKNGAYKEDDPTAPGGRKFDLINPLTNEIIPLRKNRGWRFDQKTFNKLVDEGRISFPTPNTIMVRTYLHETEKVTPQSVFYQAARSASERLDRLMDGNLFSFPKDETIIKQFVEMSTSKDSLILDFFAGSATTAHAVMQLNKEDGGHRKYICVQLPELCDEKSEAFKAGYKTIAEIGKERIRRAGAKIRKEVEEEQAKQREELPFGEEPTIKMPDLGFKVYKLSESNFKQWREIKGSNKEEWKQQVLDFINPVAENATVDNMVYELLLKSGKNLNSNIEHKNGYYTINGKELILMLETATQEVMDAVLVEHPQKVIALDNLFEGNDQLKTNTALQMRDAGVEFRTI